ncbi:MAG: hypothetical protein AAF467_12190 [Actinomycetota bacterium]
MIDQVAIRRSLGFDLVTVDEWLDLDRGEKLQLLREQRVEFLADGEEVPTREALEELRELTPAA